MAEQLKDFMFARGRNNILYPWQDWLNGKPWKLTRGADFGSPVVAFIQTARYQAKLRGLKLQSKAVDETTLVIQARKK